MRVAGSNGQQIAKRNVWNQTLGDAVEYTYKGTAGFAEGVFAMARGNCAEAELDVVGAVGIVRARYANITDNGNPEEQIRVEIRMGRNDITKDLLEPGPNGVSGLSQGQIRDLRYLVDNPGDEDFYLLWVETATNQEIELLRLMDLGVRYRRVSQPVLIQITTASSLFQWPNMSGLSGRILSNGALLGLLRQAPNFTIAASGAGPTGFNYGWYLADPIYDSTSDGHTSETLEFEFGLWPEQLFGTLA